MPASLAVSLLRSGIPSAAALTSQTITFGALGARAYGGAPFTLGATASSGLPVSLASLTSSTCTVSGVTATIVAAGTCTVQAAQAGNATYAAAASVNQSFTISKAAQTIAFTALSPAAFGSSPFTLAATASSGLPVTFVSTTTAVCTVSATTVVLIAAGTCTLQASQPGNANISAAPVVAQSFVVAKASQTLNFAPLAGRTFGSGTFTVAATTTSGLAAGFSSLTTTLCTVSASTVTLVAAGTCTIQASQAGNGNYSSASPVTQSFSIAQASQTIAFATLSGRTIGSAPFTLSATASSALAVTFASLTPSVCTVAGNLLTLASVGTCTIQANQAGNANFVASAAVSQSFSVTAANQTIAFGPLSAHAVGSAPYSIAATATSGLPVTFTSLTSPVCTVSGVTVTILSAGTCGIQASQAGNATYTAAANVTQSFVVVRGTQTIAFPTPPPQVFATAPFVVSATASSGLPVSLSALTSPTCTLVGGRVTLVAAGTCTIQASQGGDSNYNAAIAVNQSFAIARASQTISFAPLASQALGAPPFTLGAVSSSGLPVAFSSTTSTVCTVSATTVTMATAGTCGIVATQAGNANYNAAVAVAQSFSVGKSDQTITFGPLGARALGSPAFIVAANASSALVVTFSSATTSVCSVNGLTVTLLSAGTCTIQAGQVGNANYNPAPTIAQSFAVTAANQTITFVAVRDQVANSPPLALAATASSGLPVAFNSQTPPTCSVTASIATMLATGRCTVRASQAGNANYTAAPDVDRSFDVVNGAQFAAHGSVSTGLYPRGVATGDFNGDGKPDIAVSNESAGTISILLGTGDGGFVLGSTLLTGSLPFKIAVGDFNHDGKLDLAVGNISSGTVGVYLGNGDGTFGHATTVAVAAAPFGMVAADLNNDGNIDLIVANGSSGQTVGSTVQVLLGNGDGSFRINGTYVTGTGSFGVAIADINGDGKLDVAVANRDSNTLSILLGNGDGTLRPSINYPVSGGPMEIAAADLDGDGKVDLVIVTAFANTEWILLGQGDGTFAAPIRAPASSTADDIAIGDFNGDGKLDLALANPFDNNVAILLGYGDGTFRTPVVFPTGSFPSGVRAADFDGDGKLDLVVANAQGNSLSILLNGAGFTPVATLTPQSGTPQSAQVNALFPAPLSVIARDASSNPVPGAVVSFVAPTTGASGSFNLEAVG